MFTKRRAVFAASFQRLSSFPPGPQREVALEALARSIGGHLRSVEMGTNAALRKVAPRRVAAAVLEQYAEVGSTLADLLSAGPRSPLFPAFVSDLEAAVRRMNKREDAALDLLEGRLNDSALLILEVTMDQRYEDYVGVAGFDELLYNGASPAQSTQQGMSQSR